MSKVTLPDAVSYASGLLPEHRDTVRELVSNWHVHYRGNVRRNEYYESRSMLKDLGIAVPDSLKNLEVACGWGYKTVEVMRDHLIFDGFTSADDDANAILSAMARRNSLDTRVGKAVNSALKYCFSMWTVTADEQGRARVSAYPPTLSTGIWDDVNECLESGLFIVSFERDENGVRTSRPDWVDVLLPDHLIRIKKEDERWHAEYEDNGLGVVPMFVMPYNPDDDRPFGTSRITPEIQWLIDSAIRANVNEEIASAFAASTQKYLLGTDGESFENVSKWEAYIGSILEVENNADGDTPQFGQLTQPSMQPLSDHFNNLCKRMSAATGIHVGQFGMANANPSSAEAIYAENEPLILKCKSFIKEAKNALSRVCVAAYATETGTTYAEALETLDVSVHFLNPAMPTLAQQTDSSIKLASVVDGFAGTPTFWRLNGFDDDEVRNLTSECERNVTKSAVSALMSGIVSASGEDGSGDDNG